MASPLSTFARVVRTSPLLIVVAKDERYQTQTLVATLLSPHPYFALVTVAEDDDVLLGMRVTSRDDTNCCHHLLSEMVSLPPPEELQERPERYGDIDTMNNLDDEEATTDADL
ncbi:hypothetical protein GUJ93_ZPchr0002g23897 [Zizania palustris]|uniref:Uncharacterized protein n=1 Tax=Zizania palustris TaxID=103762 RepID=A0A8J5V3G6_ZIZPA|nr:hypothetical protein GUJ93_ZPchr0002g23897 [Zizania palustris]